MIDVLKNQREFTTDSKSTSDSSIRFLKESQIRGVINDAIGRLTYLILLFKQNLVVFTYRNTEDDGRNGFKTMDPFPSLRSLTPDVEHTKG